jgi:DUF1680 family protein
MIKVNGKVQPAQTAAGFVKLDRTWKKGDVVEIRLPMAPRLARGYHDSLSVSRGPLVFSYAIGEDWVKLRTRGMTAD